MPYLTEHIRKAWVSANAGDQVKIIADHGNVQIVEDKNGTRFPVKSEYLSESVPNYIPPLPEAVLQMAKARKKRIA